jgi:hypothetical protein
MEYFIAGVAMINAFTIGWLLAKKRRQKSKDDEWFPGGSI